MTANPTTSPKLRLTLKQLQRKLVRKRCKTTKEITFPRAAEHEKYNKET